jgi:RNA polymerase sigma-70 factor, ECF subfamily
MASIIQQANFTGLTAYLPVASADYREIYEENRDRIYSLAFWMTDNELAAEELLGNVFCRAFALSGAPSQEAIDRSLITELRQTISLGTLTLKCSATTQVANVRSNTLRVHLERAVVQLPSTERMVFLLHDVESYNHPRIAHLLGINEQESQHGLHQARLRLRELLAGMRD